MTSQSTTYFVGARSERPWWRDAVTYQIYPRSYVDANGDGTMTWIEAGKDLLAFSRTDEASGKSFACYVNFGAPIAMPAGEVIVASSELDGQTLPSDTTVWLHI